MFNDYNYVEPASSATAGWIVFYVILAAIAVAEVIGYWKLFEKAGEAGWKAFIPFYNSYTLFKIAWGNGLLFLLLYLPFVNSIIYIALQYKVAKAYGYDAIYALGLLFVPVLFYPMLGFNNCQYVGPDGKRAPVYVFNQYNFNTGDSDSRGSFNTGNNFNSDSGFSVGNSFNRGSNSAMSSAPQQGAENESEFKFCIHCGEKVNKDAKFCKYCGAKLAGSESFSPDKLKPTELVLPSIPDDIADEYSDKTEILLDEPIDFTPSVRLTPVDAENSTGETITIERTPFVIGRSESNTDYSINIKGISRRHMQIDYTDNTFRITDLNSTNGTTLNGHKITPMTASAITSGDTITFGHRTYKVETIERPLATA